MVSQTEFSFSTSENEEIFEVAITGTVTRETLDQLHKEMIKLLERQDFKALLVDVRELKGDQDTFAAAYFRTRSIPPEYVRAPAAMVDSNDDVEYISFYETTAANVGYSWKWFTDIEAARAWLKSRL